MAKFDLQALPPKEAVDAFQRKGFRIGFAWQDVWQEEHSRSFTVAKAMSVDILSDIRVAVMRAIRDGKTLEQFRKELTPVLQDKGWWGRQLMPDPLTGQIKSVQLGSPRRLRTIYDTNLRMSHAAGQWERIERTKKARPYLRYVAILDARTRPLHRAWHNTTLPVDDPWWDAHSPPCGWHCRCGVQQLSERDIARMGLTVGDAPPSAMVSWRNPRTGQVLQVPVGVDPGFGYNVGQSALARSREVLTEKLDGAPEGIARASTANLVADPGFASFLAGRSPMNQGSYPVAAVPERLANPLKLRFLTATLPSAAVQREALPPAAAWKPVQDVLDRGEISGSGSSRKLSLKGEDGKVFELEIRRNSLGRLEVSNFALNGP